MSVNITGTDPGSYVPLVVAPSPGATVRAEDVQIVAQAVANQTKHINNVVSDGTYAIACASIVAGLGGLASGIGVKAVGGTGSAGVQGTGGTGGGVGVDAIGTSNAPGTTSLGNGVGAGIVATGGASGGTGVKAVAGSGGVALEVSTGNAKFTGSQPVKTADPGANNYACGTNMCKAWAIITLAVGTVTLVDGYNVASVTVNATDLTINMARAMSSANYAPVASTSGAYVPEMTITGSSQFNIELVNTPTGGANAQATMNAITTTVFVHVFGRQ